MKEVLIVILAVVFVSNLEAQSEHSLLREGDSHYKKKEYLDAGDTYMRVLKENPNSVKGNFNLGAALYKAASGETKVSEDMEMPSTGDAKLDAQLKEMQAEMLGGGEMQNMAYEEASEYFAKAAENAKSPEIKSKALYNLGNTLFKQKKFEESIESYKNALRLNPKDMDTKQNLQMAIQAKKVQEQQQQQQQQQQEQEKEEEQDENQEQQQEQQQQQEEEEGEEENQEQEAQEQEEQQEVKEGEEGEKEEPKDLDKEEARQLLKIMDDEERKVQEKMKKAQSKPNKSKKDW